jgi:ribosomal protein S18 acetylase RimI-like enzyme
VGWHLARDDDPHAIREVIEVYAAAMDDLTISLAGPDRLDDLEPVYRALYDHHVAVSAWRPAPERGPDVAWQRRRGRWEATLLSSNGVGLVAERDGRVVGALIGEVEKPADGSDTYAVPTSTAHVHDLAVLPEAQGGGVGRALMERFEAILRERDIESYGLEVMAGNEAARGFYDGLGLELAQLTLYKVLPKAG